MFAIAVSMPAKQLLGFVVLQQSRNISRVAYAYQGRTLEVLSALYAEGSPSLTVLSIL